MPQMVFRVVGLSVTKSLQAQERIKLLLRATGGDAFGDGEADGYAEMSVVPEFVKQKKLALGDDVTVDIQER